MTSPMPFAPRPSRASQARTAAMQTMSSDLQAEMRALDEFLQQESPPSTLSQYRLGHHLKRIHDDTLRFGSNAIELLLSALHKHGPRMRKAMALVEWLPTHPEMQSVLDRGADRGITLTWGHFSELLRLRDVSVRQEYLESVFRLGLSAARLKRLISAQLRPSPPRTILSPSSANGALSRLSTAAYRFGQGLRGEYEVARPLLDEVEARNQVTEEFLEKLANTHQEMVEYSRIMAQWTRDLSTRLTRYTSLFQQARAAPTDQQVNRTVPGVRYDA